MKGRAIGCAAMVGLTGLATACPPGACEEVIIEAPGGALTWTGSFDTALGDDPVWTAASPGHAFATSDEDSVQISVYNNEIKVVRNGKPVPPDHVQHEDGVVKILDDNGEVVSEIQLAFSPEQAQWEKAVTVFGQPAEHPPVMLGITMGEPDEALRAHLGLGERQVIMLDNVMDGLPAAEAGLKRFDIIVAIEGSDDGVNPEKLLEVLKGKQPGEELKLRVLRGGQKETYVVKLRPYDESALSSGASAPETGITLDLIPKITTVPSAPTAPAMPAMPAMPTPPAAPAFDVEGILNKLRQQGLSDQQIDMVKKTLRQSIEQSKRVEIMRGPQGNMFIQGPDGQTRMIMVPDAEGAAKAQYLRDLAGAGHSQALEERLGAMEKRLDEMSSKMDERLERVLRRVEQLTEQLERRVRDGG